MAASSTDKPADDPAPFSIITQEFNWSKAPFLKVLEVAEKTENQLSVSCHVGLDQPLGSFDIPIDLFYNKNRRYQSLCAQ